MMRAQPMATDAVRYVRVLDGACTAGHARSCNRLAQTLSSSPAVPRDDGRIRKAYERGCALADGASCLSMVGTADGWMDKLGPVRARLAAGCDAHDGRSCGVLAALVLALDRDRDASTALATRSVEYLSERCTAGDAEECMMAVRQLDAIGRAPGGPSAELAARIKPLLDRGCELGDGEPCMLVAMNSPDLSASERDALFRRSCTLGRPESCLILARQALDAGSPDASAALAHGLALAEAQCNLADEPSCRLLADALVLDALSSAEVARTTALVERTCERGSVLVCVHLADALERAPASRRDPARSQALRDRACKLGYPFTCPDPKAAPTPAP